LRAGEIRAGANITVTLRPVSATKTPAEKYLERKGARGIMKIESYSVGMSSTSVSSKSLTTGQKTTISGREAAPVPLMRPELFWSGPGNRSRGIDMLSLSPEALGLQPNQSGQPDRSDRQDQSNRPDQQNAPSWTNRRDNQYAVSGQLRHGMATIELSDKDRFKLTLLERMIEALTGRKYKFNFQGVQSGQGPNAGMIQFASFPQTQGQRTGGEVRTTTESFIEYRESQQMTFQASGLVNTSDGRQIRFDMNLFASYEFAASITTISDRAFQLCDPLILNFDGTLPEFTKDRYEFDLMIGNGALENIFMPTNGSGFLALDKNGDGVINDGSELFGAQTGNGFWELAAYDEDGNGWIDEGDPVFENLKLMFVDKDSGEAMLLSLKDAGVGAIFLGSVASEYELKGSGSDVIGQIRRSGVFLNESGTVGSVHHIDLTY